MKEYWKVNSGCTQFYKSEMHIPELFSHVAQTAHKLCSQGLPWIPSPPISSS